MPKVLFPQSSPSVEFTPLPHPDESPAAEGVEGREIASQLLELMHHWLDRSEDRHIVAGDDPSGYRHLPLRMVGQMRVRYGQSKPLVPRKFLIDEGTP